MATALDLIKAGMWEAGGVLPRGATPTTAEQTDFLALLNSLIDQCNASELYLFQVKNESFTWPAATASRTIGASGNFNTVRPQQILGAFWRDSANADTPLDVVEWDSHARVWDKSTFRAPYPDRLYYDTGYTLGTIYLTPIPSGEGGLHLQSRKLLSSIAAVGDTIAFPPGYQRFLELHLAKAIARQSGREVPADLERDWMEARRIVKSPNIKVPTLQLPAELASLSRSSYDINRG